MLGRCRAYVVLLLPASAVVAQTAAAQNTGTVVGTVTDARSLTAIAGVVIRVVGRQQTAVTRPNGGFRLQLTDDNMRSITLRGLAPDQVLVLVNGKRRHTAAIVETTVRC
jgi:outer membrane receptor for ferrienterochelin and colicin